MIIEDQRSDRVLRSPGLPVHESVPVSLRSSGVKPSKSDPYACFVLYCAVFDIISIETRHETSDELSTSSKYDGVASCTLRPGARENVHPALWRG